MKIPNINKLSKTSQLSLLAVVILLGAIFFTVNTALQQQKGATHAAGCYRNGVLSFCTPISSYRPPCLSGPHIQPGNTLITCVTPTPTISPTKIPTPTPTIGYAPPTATPVISSSPTTAVSPTNSPVPGDTVLAVTVGLDGIGMAGDRVSPNTQGNMSPLHPTRTINMTIFNSQNQQVASLQGTITYNTTTGYFDGTVDLGSQFASGLYTVKIQTDQYLRGLVPGIQTITAGQTNTLPYLALIAGDINDDNQINILDYNILMGCYSDLLPAVSCTQEQQAASDLNDDGAVNQFDYNLFLRELSNVGGQ